MLRTILLLLALVVLVVAALFYFNVLHWPGGNQPVQANPVEVKTEMRTVNVPVPVVTTPASQPPANAPPAAPH